MTDRTGGIVLAGGRSSRFGRDKLAEPIDGRRMLDHAIAAVAAVASAGDVVVVLAPGDDRPLPPGAVAVHDDAPFRGPLAGLARGLAALDPAADRVVVVGGDMPGVMPAVLRRLVRAVDEGSDGATLERDGIARPMPAAYRRSAALPAAHDLLANGEARLRALPERLGATALPWSDWSSDDPEGASLRDIDVPADR